MVNKIGKKERSKAKENLRMYVTQILVIVIAGIIITHQMIHPYTDEEIMNVQQYVEQNLKMGNVQADVVVENDSICKFEKNENTITFYYKDTIRTLVYEIKNDGSIEFKKLGFDIHPTVELVMSTMIWMVVLIFLYNLKEYTDELYLEKKLHK